MTFRTLNLCFPLVLAVHNAEEYFQADAFGAVWLESAMQKRVTRRILRNAMLLLTASAALTSIATFLSRDKRLLILSRAATFALLLNALGHGAASLVRRRWLPGSVSAVWLILPYSAAAIAAMRVSRGELPRFLFRSAVLGAVTLPLATGGFLAISFGLARVERLRGTFV